MSEQIERHVQQVSAMLRSVGRPEVADEIVRTFAAPASGKPVVFVAGEDKRGKSSLVNALLAKPDMSPVGNEVVTSAPITFFYSAEPTASVFYYGKNEPEAASVEQARSLATVQGNPGNNLNVRAVRIGDDSVVLSHMNLVDTPGVGGLTSGHGTLTLQALRHADALIFVIEAGAQFRGEELAFLQEAAQRIDTVVFAMTKVDVNRAWRTILDDNKRILREKAPRYADCPFVPVSSALAMRALKLDDPEEAAAVREEAGLSELERVLRDQVLSRSNVLKQRNAVRLGATAMAALERTITERLSALDDGGETRRRLEAEQGRLKELNRDRAEWPQTLDAEIRKLTMERSEITTVKTLEIRHHYEQRLKTLTALEREQLPTEVVADLTALAGTLNEATAERLSDLVKSLVSELDTLATVQESIDDIANDSLREELESNSIGSHDLTSSDKVSLVGSFSSGRSISEFVTGGLGSGLGLSTTAFLAPPLGLLLGVSIGGFFAFQAFKGRSQQAFTAEFRAWMGEQISQATLAINSTFSRKMIDLQNEIKRAIQGALEAREKEITESLAASQELMRTEVAKRKQISEELARHRDAAHALGDQATAILSSLGRAPAAVAG